MRAARVMGSYSCAAPRYLGVPPAEKAVDGGQDEERERGRGDEAADDDGGEGALDFVALGSYVHSSSCRHACPVTGQAAFPWI